MRELDVLEVGQTQAPTSQTVSQALHCAQGRKLRGCLAKVQDEEWVKICAGVYLESSIFDGRASWDQRRIVAMARAFAAAQTGHRVLTGLSAVLIFDLPVLNVPGNVTAFQTALSGTAPTLAPVVVHNHMIMPVGHVVRRKLLAPDLLSEYEITTDRPGSVTTEMLSAALITIACTEPPEDAFVALCMGLHHATGIDHIRNDRQRQKIEDARSFLLRRLNALPKGTRGVRRARLLIKAADGGCDSVGEARLVWVLKCAGIQGICTQHMVPTSEGTFYVDVAIPSIKLAIEFDGFSKYDSSPMVHQQWSLQHRREEAIRRYKYVIHRFQWENFNQPARMLTDLDAQLASRGQGLPRILTDFAKEFNGHVF